MCAPLTSAPVVPFHRILRSAHPIFGSLRSIFFAPLTLLSHALVVNKVYIYISDRRVRYSKRVIGLPDSQCLPVKLGRQSHVYECLGNSSRHCAPFRQSWLLKHISSTVHYCHIILKHYVMLCYVTSVYSSVIITNNKAYS